MPDYKKGHGGGPASGPTAAQIASRRRVRNARQYVKDNPPTWSDTHVTATHKADKAATATAPVTTSSGSGAGQGGGGHGGRRHRNSGAQRNSGNNLLARARRDFMLSVKPYLQELRRTRQQAGRDTQQQVTQIGNVNDALQTQLAGLADPYQQTMSGISSELASNLGGLASTMQQNIGAVPEAERAAGTGLVSSLGAGSLGTLATTAARGAGYNTSAQRQGAIEGAVTSRNALADLANFQRDLGQRRNDIMSTSGASIRQRMDELRQQQLSRYLALQNLALQRGQFGLSERSLNNTIHRGALADAQAAADAAAYAAWLASHQTGGP